MRFAVIHCAAARRVGRASLLAAAGLSFVAAPLAAQTKVDTLLTRLRSARDTARVDVLTDLAGALARRDSRKALEYGATARDESKRLGYVSGHGTALYQMGLAYFALGDVKNAITSQQSALKLLLPIQKKSLLGYVYNHLGNALSKEARSPEAERAFVSSIHWHEVAGDTAGLAYAHNNLGILYWQTSRYDSAFAHYQTVLTLRQALRDSAGVASAINNIGVLEYQRGDYEAALASYLRSLEMRRRLGDRKGTALVLNNIGKTYQDWGQMDRAESAIREGLVISEALGDKSALGYSLNNLGALQEALGDHPKAEASYRRSLSVYGDGKQVDGVVLNLTSLGRLSLSDGKPGPALTMLRQAVTLARSTTNREQEARALSARGMAHLALGGKDAALHDLDRALGIARSIGQRQLSRDILGDLSTVHAAREEYRLALERHRAHAALGDSLFDESSGRRIATMQADFKAARREQENAVLRSGQQVQAALIARQRQGFVLGGIILVIVVILALVLLRSNRANVEANRLLADANRALEEKNERLNEAMGNIKTLKGFVPICSRCKNIRDDEGFWEKVETYVSKHSEALFSHGVCPDCMEILYPDLQDDMVEELEPQG